MSKHKWHRRLMRLPSGLASHRSTTLGWEIGDRCPLWVKGGRDAPKFRCPLYRRKRTLRRALDMIDIVPGRCSSSRGIIMKLSRRRCLRLAVGAAALPVLARRASALDYPSRPVRLIVGFPAGSSSDLTARLIAQWLSERLGQQFNVENRTGAGTNIATESVVHAVPDGYTLLWVTHANAFNATLYDTLAFNFIRDIQPVASVLRVPAVMEVTPATLISTPMRRTRSGCCARAVSGRANVAPPRRVTNSRRRMCPPLRTKPCARLEA